MSSTPDSTENQKPYKPPHTITWPLRFVALLQMALALVVFFKSNEIFLLIKLANRLIYTADQNMNEPDRFWAIYAASHLFLTSLFLFHASFKLNKRGMIQLVVFSKFVTCAAFFIHYHYYLPSKSFIFGIIIEGVFALWLLLLSFRKSA